MKENLSALELNELILNNKVAIIDVRSLEEFNYYHINKAYNININELSLNKVLNVLQSNKDESKIIITYCNAGGRGGRAFTLLKEQNQQSDYLKYGLCIKNLQYGINEWISLGLPIVKQSV